MTVSLLQLSVVSGPLFFVFFGLSRYHLSLFVSQIDALVAAVVLLASAQTCTGYGYCTEQSQSHRSVPTQPNAS